MKFKVGDKVRVREDLEINKMYGNYGFIKEMAHLKGEITTIKEVLKRGYRIEEYCYTWTDEMLEEVKKEAQQKTFREVIADIKEGEVWESVQDCFQLSEITCFEGRIRFSLKNVFVDIVDGNNNVDTGAGGGQTFKLKRKEYTFEEAYKKAKEGAEIQSLASNIKYKKYDENTMMFKDKDMDDFAGISNDNAIFSVDEIQGKWFINN